MIQSHRNLLKLILISVVISYIFSTVQKTRKVRNYKVQSISFLNLFFQQEVLIIGTSPTKVWEYMADFSNHKLLNPHLISWNIVSDSSHLATNVRRQFTVTYTEMFELLPIITNTASANYTVLQNEETQVEDKGKVKKKLIETNHC